MGELGPGARNLLPVPAMNFPPIALLLALAFSAGFAIAQPAAAPTTPTPTPLPAVTLPPELDRVLRDYEKFWTGKDLEGLTKIFTTDGMALPNGHPPAQGAAAIEAAYGRNIGTLLSLRAIAFSTSGELGYIIGYFTDAPGKPDHGKFVLLLRKGKDGRWLIIADMDNANARRSQAPSSVPAASPTPAQKPT